MTRVETIHSIRALLAVADFYRNAIFLIPPSWSLGRQQEETRGYIPEFSWTEGGHRFTASYSVCCTDKRVIARGYYTRDGKKTNLTAIKNSLKRLEEEQEQEQEEKENV